MHDLAAHRMALEVLDEHRSGRAAVDADVEDRAGVGQRVAQDARVDGEVRRLAVAAVDDAGHVALRRSRRAVREPSGSRAVRESLWSSAMVLGVAAGRGIRARRAADDGSEMASGATPDRVIN